MNINVNDFLYLFLEDSPIQFYIDGYVYLFPTKYMIPDEILSSNVESIDNPYYYEEIHPLCINLNPNIFEEFKGLKDKIKDFLYSE